MTSAVLSTASRAGRRVYGHARAAVRAPPIARAVRSDHLTMLSLPALHDLWDAVRRIEAHGVPGACLEAGCARGGSAVVLCAAKSTSRPLVLYDTFDLIPAPGVRDGDAVHHRYDEIVSGRARGIGDRPYYGYVPELETEVLRTLEAYGVPPSDNRVTTVRGLYEETLHPDGPVRDRARRL